jgi:hypothetical protein
VLQIDRYPDPKALQTHPVGRVFFRGKWVVPESIEVTRELGSGLPEQVVGASGMVEATATVVLAPENLVSRGFNLPWRNARKPLQGESILIELGLEDDGAEAYGRYLTGRVDSCDGEVTDPTISVECVDLSDKMDRDVSLEPLFRVMPPYNPNTDSTMRAIGVHPSWLTARLAAACGFHATPPPREGETCISAPLIGSTWPNRGGLLRSQPRVGEFPGYASTPWGVGVTDIGATWLPNRSAVRTLRLARSGFVEFLATAPTGEGTHHIILDWSGADRIHIRVGGSLVSVGAGTDATISPQVSCTFPADAYATGYAHVSVWVDSDGRAAVRIGSAEATGSVNVTSPMVETELQQVRLVSETDMRAIGGLNVGFTAGRYDLHTWKPSAVIDSPYNNIWLAFPGLEGENVMDVLKEQSESELAAIWLDGEGRFQYRTRARLTSAAPVGDTITMDDLDSLPWSEQWSSLRSRVRVKYASITRMIGPKPTNLVWQGSGTSLEPGETYEEVAEPNDKVSWLGVDAILKNPVDHVARFQRRDGTYVGGTVETDAENGEGGSFLAGNSYMTSTLVKNNDRSYTFTVVPTSNVSANQRLVLNTQEPSSLFRRFHDQDLPILRACGVFKLHETELVSEAVGSTKDAPEYVHDGKWFIQSGGPAKSIGDQLALYTAQPLPVLDYIGVTPDDRRELGDVLRLELIGKTNSQGKTVEKLTMTALCVGIKDSLENDNGAPKRTQQLRLQPIEIGV